MTIDATTHSLFGASKVAADILVQEYGRYFGMNTAVFRGGCLTGPGHSGAELHGFLAYLMKCTVTGQPYTVFGYDGKQVRDNLHAHDLVAAFEHFAQARASARSTTSAVGGMRTARCSKPLMPASESAKTASDQATPTTIGSATTSGGSPTSASFKTHYPDWDLTYSIEGILTTSTRGRAPLGAA